MSQIGQPINQAGQSPNMLSAQQMQMLQQYQAMQRQQQMAQALMQQGQQQQQQNMTAPYAGVSNAGSQLAGAAAMNNMNQNANWAAQGLGPVNVTPNQATGMGGSNSMLQNAGAYLGNLFGFGSGVGS